MSWTLTRRGLLRTGAWLTSAAAAPPGVGPATAARSSATGSGRELFPVRAVVASLNHPYWHADHGYADSAKAFWDKTAWEDELRGVARCGYNALIYSCDPWLVHQWQTWLVRYDRPEDNDLLPEQSEPVIAQVRWLFRTAKELGLRNFLMTMFVVTSQSFARAHGLDRDMPVSEAVDWRHNYQHASPGGATYDKMIHWGVRNELTRAFTEEAIAKLFRTYGDLDGLRMTLGEALPGKRSRWFREAVVPGLKRSGRRPIVIFNHWMVPLREALEDVAPRDVYENTWIGISHNGEALTDTKPYPISVRYAQQTGLPVFIECVTHNVSVLPCNSPRFACEMVHEGAKVGEGAGFAYLVTGRSLLGPDHDLFGRALAYYARTDEQYSDAPWVALLAERFGDPAAARHFVNAYNASGAITPAVNAIAWCPHDGRCPNQLLLRYWHWTDQDERFSHYADPALGTTLLPVRHYARVVAQQGPAFRNNDGSRYIAAPGTPLTGHPGVQELIWGDIDYPVTPEAHMRQVCKLGDLALAEAEAGMKSVKRGMDRARELYNQMKAYQLLTEYYEHKVLAAISALLYGLTGQDGEKARAERLADETVALYARAANFMWEELDHRSGQIKGGWWDEQRDLPGLIEAEKQERVQLGTLFHWLGQGRPR
jgi:hypothetical protein